METETLYKVEAPYLPKGCFCFAFKKFASNHQQLPFRSLLFNFFYCACCSVFPFFFCCCVVVVVVIVIVVVVVVVPATFFYL